MQELCERLGLERVAVVGNSMGGFIAAELAIQQPVRVERLVLVSAAGISSANVYRDARPDRGPHRRRGDGQRDRSTTGASPRRPRARQLALALVARHPRLLAPDLAYEGLMRGANKPGFFAALRACIEYDFRERLPEIEAPTLIVWGEDDSILSVQRRRRVRAADPDARRSC